MRGAMKANTLRIGWFILCWVALSGLGLNAQQRPGPPPGGPPPGPPSSPPPGLPSSTASPSVSGDAGARAVTPPAITIPKPSANAVQSVHFGPVGRWWDNRDIVKTIGLNSGQKKEMDAIFDSNKPAILASYKNFLQQQSRLATISKDPKADKTLTFAAIDAVNQARADLQKATAQLYLQIRQQMTAEQIEKLQKLQ